MISLHRLGQVDPPSHSSSTANVPPAASEGASAAPRAALDGPAMPLIIVSLATAVLTIGVVGPVSFVFGWSALWLPGQDGGQARHRVRLGWMVFGLNLLLVAAAGATMLWIRARGAVDLGPTNGGLVA